ncbi:MAG TPA: hypothetical protein PKJ95_00895 [Atribacterota bacterium]|nr:hypothetical protein [Atribacterota bacterium]
MGGEGAAGYNGCAAIPGYLLQQKLKRSRPWLRLQHIFYYALQAAQHRFCFLPAAAPIFAMVRICGAMPGKPASPGLYRTGASRI